MFGCQGTHLDRFRQDLSPLLPVLDADVEDQVLFRVADLFHLTAPSFCACDSAEAAAL